MPKSLLPITSNGSSQGSNTVTLQWSTPTSWGTKCPAPNVNQYEVYVGPNNPPSNLRTTVNVGTNTYNFTGARGTTYYWFVRATNRSRSTDSSVGSFTILTNTVTGTVYLAPAGTCSTATPWSSGGVSVALDAKAGVSVGSDGRL